MIVPCLLIRLLAISPHEPCFILYLLQCCSVHNRHRVYTFYLRKVVTVVRKQGQILFCIPVCGGSSGLFI